MTTTTFVTAFYSHCNINREHFRRIAETGLNICLYSDSEQFTEFSNVKILAPFTTSVSNIYANGDGSWPIEQSDNSEHFINLNSKPELIENAIKINPWNSTHFAWIDFSIFSIFNNYSESQTYLKTLATRTLCKRFLAIPGWLKDKTEIYEFNDGFTTVRWRFLDKFFIGDKDSLIEMATLTKQYFPLFLRTYKTLTWEVNFWNWLETFTGWNPLWYSAKFDDSVIKIPAWLYSKPLSDISKKQLYNYPSVYDETQYYETSASHIFFQGRHILNTRFVNYFLLEGGQYYMANKNGFIITKNVVSELDADTMNPISHNMFSDDTVGLEEPEYPENEGCNVYGLEDIRLYEYNNKLRFIATNRNYSPIYKNRMVVGDYNIENLSYDNCRLIDSPFNSQYEKNWIPICYNGEECFIYSWFPMDIYRFCSESNSIEHVCRHMNTMTAPNFYRVRGSSTFVDFGDVLIGVVHFSEETVPRQYYHMLVSLEKNTYKPLRYSETFYFQYIGVEFCTGFCIKDGSYVFWVSKKDRNACKFSVDIDRLPLRFEF
jgi:hypothetical protein